MICPRCQTHNPVGMRICAHCGYDLTAFAAPSPPPAPPRASLAAPRPAISSTLPQALPPPPYPPRAAPPPYAPPFPSTTIPLVSAPAVSHPTRPPSKGMRWALLIGAAVLVLLAGAGGGALLLLRPQPAQPNTRANPRAGRWMAVATAAPGQPAPTVPPGAYAFKDLTGNLIVYYPPADPPVLVNWQTYQDAQHGFHLDFPGNWTQIDQSPTLSGARMVCPPGADTQEDAPGTPMCVTYGWVPSFTLPSPSDPTVTDFHAISAGTVSGYQFSESTLGSVITAVFPNGSGYVVISTFANSDALLYAFQHMVATLTFS